MGALGTSCQPLRHSGCSVHACVESKLMDGRLEWGESAYCPPNVKTFSTVISMNLEALHYLHSVSR